MSLEKEYVIGLDAGSVSLNAVALGADGTVLHESYDRHHGDHCGTCRTALLRIFEHLGRENLSGLALTGSGAPLLTDLLGGNAVNEVLAQSCAAARFHPEARSVIEMGGEDSKLLIMKARDGESALEDFAMNTVCAAGTGSFLDQQAARVGISIEDEFGRLASRSKHPPRIAGRCSVFAKSDMIHLQQIATPVEDILAGLCFALARNFKSDIGRGKTIETPVAFQGGVAANSGMVRAFRDVLELREGDLIIPRHYASMGAIGAALLLQKSSEPRPFRGVEALERHLAAPAAGPGTLTGLAETEGTLPPRNASPRRCLPEEEVYLGIDIGSISTNVVAIDKDGRLLSKRYLMTASRPIEAVRKGIREVGEEIGTDVRVLGVGTTGSGRYMIGDFVGADVIRNEITAQATAALAIDEDVDTIFEIGGQDSKYISLRGGAVVDFEMNKVCAAGTGSFLEEQAERLGIAIDGEFGSMALSAERPAILGERCTVFMDTDLVRQQQQGTGSENLAAGLCYSIVHNYLNKVVGDRPVGDRIFLQGGIAFNAGVVAAFQKITDKTVTVPPNHDVTGAIGAALMARAESSRTSRFRGFDLVERPYRQDSFTCGSCSNSCEINRVRPEGEKPLLYGGRCEKYEVRRGGEGSDDIPLLFSEREEMLLGSDAGSEVSSRTRIGVPRVLHFYEYYPFWKAFLSELGCEAVPSGQTTGKMIRQGMETVSAEVCYPVKLSHGHILSLLEEGIDAVLLPSIISFPRLNGSGKNVSCPYSQAIPFLANAALAERLQGVQVFKPVVDFQYGRNTAYAALLDLGHALGASKTAVSRAFAAAEAAQAAFYEKVRQRGAEALELLGEGRRGLVLVGRSYNTCDAGINLGLPRKIRDHGLIAFPMDFLPLDERDGDVRQNMYWRSGKRILAAGRFLRGRRDLLPVYFTNFGCGPDSFISHSFREVMAGSPYLQLEIDEHSADAGAMTRLEAFLDSLPADDTAAPVPGYTPSRRKPAPSLRERTIYLPRMSDHAVALAAAFRALGQPAEVLPPPDDSSAALGRKHTSGKECYPCIVTTGDLVRKVTSEGFNPGRSAFFMPGADGPCRFGQYRGYQERVLENLGFGEVPFVSPSASRSYADLEKGYDRIAWDGVLAIDALDRLRRRFRPYVLDAAEAEHIYTDALEAIGIAIESRRDLLPLLTKAAESFASLPHRAEDRPLIGVVGEIFLRSNEFSNEDLVRKIERFGGEVLLAPVSEWILYTNFTRGRRARQEGRYTDALKAWIRNRYQCAREKRFADAIEVFIGNGHEPPTSRLLRYSSPYLHDSFEGEAVLTIGKSVDMARRGIAGVVSAMPFTCMPGTVSAAVAKRVRADFNAFPYLNMVYDGQGGAGSDVRLEAFIHQARSYALRQKKELTPIRTGKDKEER